LIVPTETKQVTVRGKKFTIQRFGLKEGAKVDALIDQAKGDVEHQQAITVFYGVVKPKFESIEEVENGDRETMLHLWIEVQRFNQYETSFLSLLKNSPLQVSQPEGTQGS
jgi:hypothetical protein